MARYRTPKERFQIAVFYVVVTAFYALPLFIIAAVVKYIFLLTPHSYKGGT